MRKNYKEIIKMTLAIIGAIVGICGCAVFAGKYHNYNAAVWAAVSAKFALFFLLIVFFAHRDVERKIMPVRFKLCIVISGIGMVMGLSVFIAYLVVGATSNERGIVCICISLHIVVLHLIIIIISRISTRVKV